MRWLSCAAYPAVAVAQMGTFQLDDGLGDMEEGIKIMQAGSRQATETPSDPWQAISRICNSLLETTFLMLITEDNSCIAVPHIASCRLPLDTLAPLLIHGVLSSAGDRLTTTTTNPTVLQGASSGCTTSPFGMCLRISCCI